MKKPPLLLTIGAAIALVSGGAFAYWWLNRQNASASVLTGAEALPADTLMTISVSTNAEQWQRLRQFGTPTTQAWLDDQLVEWRDRLLAENGLEFNTDIQPWVGDRVTIAILPPVDPPPPADPEPPAPDAPIVDPDAPPDSPAAETDPTDPPAESVPPEEDTAAGDDAPAAPPPADERPIIDRQPTLVILPIANPVAAQEILTSGDLELSGWETATYRDVEVRQGETPAGARYAAALGTEFVVVATTDEAMEAAIDAYKGKSPLVNTPGLRPAFNQLRSSRPFAQVYVNVPVATTLTDVPNEALPPQGLSSLQDSQGMAIAATLETDGVFIEGLSWLSTESDRTYAVVNNAGQLPTLLPDSTVLMVSSGNLQQLWQDYVQTGANQPALSPLHPDNLQAQFQALTGLNLTEDVLSWMADEAAFALVRATATADAADPDSDQAETPAPTNSDPAAITPMFLFQASDRNLADTQLTAFEDILSDRYRFQIDAIDVAGQSVATWSSPFGALSIVQSWIPEDVLLLTLGTEVAATVLPEPSTPLANDPTFQAVTARSTRPNNGHFYVDVEALLQRNPAFPLPQIPPAQAETLQAVQAIGVTAAIVDARTARYDIHVLIESNPEIEPLPDPATSPEPTESPAPSDAPDASESEDPSAPADSADAPE